MSKRTIASRLGAAAATALLLAGCTAAGGGEASPSPSASPSATASVIAQPDPNHPDPCALLTAQDFADGGIPEMSEGRFIGSLSGTGRSICRWTPAAEDLSVPRVQVILNWEHADLAAQRALADGIGAGTEDFGIEGATAAYAAYGGRTIAMSVGPYLVQVSYTLPSAPADQVRNTSAFLATVIASRL